MSAISVPNASAGAGLAAATEQGVPLSPQWLLPSVLLGVVAGAALQLQQPVLWPVAAYWTLLTAAALAGWAAHSCQARQRRTAPGGSALWPRCFALLAGALAVYAACGLRGASYLEQTLAPELEGRDIRITAIVAAMPQVNEGGKRMRLALESAQLRGQSVRLPPLIDVAWYGGLWRHDPGGDELAELQGQPPEIRAGDRWELTVRLKAPHGLRNPHGFDYELWMWEQGVQATGYVRTGTKDVPPVWLGSTWRHPVERARQTVRDAIMARLTTPAAADSGTAADAARARTAGVIAALVTGDQRAIDRADWDIFRATGVAHLMSISGLHITLFAWLAAWVVRALWRRSARLCLAMPAPTAALMAGVVLAAGYALFSGWGVPAQRTVIMLACIAALQLGGRRWPWPQVWLLACAAVVLVDPWALAQAGFWLSFVAVGVLFASNPIAGSARQTSAAGHFVAMLREQWTVTLALTPLGMLLFGQVSVVGFAANLVAIPWVTLVVTPLALGGMLWAPLWSLAALSLQPLAALLQWLSQWPWAVLFLPATPLWAGTAAVAGGGLLAMRLPWRVRLLALPLIWPVLWWQPERPPAGEFELLAADIGQGNAVLVRTATHALLYDAGPAFSRESDAGHRVLVPLLRALGERVDVLLLSHRDADHTGGAQAVLAQQPQARVIGSIEAGHPLQSIRPVGACLAGQHWEWDGVRFDVLHPKEASPAQSAPPNAASCVLRITAAGGGSALLAGDVEAAQEKALAAAGAPLRVDLLLVPHHGSRTSSSAELLDAAAPRTALVQAGYRNRFGHPAKEVMQRYQARQITVVENTRCGAAAWSSRQPQAVQCERDVRQRYWQHRTGSAGS